MNYRLNDDDPPVSIVQRDELIGWATWPPYRPEEVAEIRGIKRHVGEALVRKGLATGPWHDYPEAWKVVLTEKGQDLARRWAEARKGQAPAFARPVVR